MGAAEPLPGCWEQAVMLAIQNPARFPPYLLMPSLASAQAKGKADSSQLCQKQHKVVAEEQRLC